MKKREIHTEALLLEGLRRGNHSSFRLLYDMYGGHLYNFSYKLLKSKNAAEDIVQETFFKVWNRREKIQSSGSFKSFLFTIALNSIRHSFNQIARENALKDSLLIDFTKKSDEFSEEDDYEMLVEKLQQLIQQMPEKRRIVFYKKKIEGRKATEIASELNISLKTVEYHVAEAMKFLKEEFKSMDKSGTLLFLLLSSIRKK